MHSDSCQQRCPLRDMIFSQSLNSWSRHFSVQKKRKPSLRKHIKKPTTRRWIVYQTWVETKSSSVFHCTALCTGFRSVFALNGLFLHMFYEQKWINWASYDLVDFTVMKAVMLCSCENFPCISSTVVCKTSFFVLCIDVNSCLIFLVCFLFSVSLVLWPVSCFTFARYEQFEVRLAAFQHFMFG